VTQRTATCRLCNRDAPAGFAAAHPLSRLVFSYIVLPKKEPGLKLSREHSPAITHGTLASPVLVHRTRCFQNLKRFLSLVSTDPCGGLNEQKKSLAPGRRWFDPFAELECVAQTLSSFPFAIPFRQCGNLPSPNRRLPIIVLTFPCRFRRLTCYCAWITVRESCHPGQSLRPKPRLFYRASLIQRFLRVTFR
jgi:hypothetical protein